MEDQTEILNDLTIVIESLKNQSKCENLAFQKIWRDKYYNVKLRINKLNEDDYKSLESKYQKWYKDNYE